MPGTGLGITTGKTAFSDGKRAFITLKERRTGSTEGPAVQFGHLHVVSQSLPAVPLPAAVESTRVFQKRPPAPFVAIQSAWLPCLSAQINSCFSAMDKGHTLTFCFTAKFPPPNFSLCKAMGIRQPHHEVRAFASILDLAAGKNTGSVRTSLWLWLCMYCKVTYQTPSFSLPWLTQCGPIFLMQNVWQWELYCDELCKPGS